VRSLLKIERQIGRRLPELCALATLFCCAEGIFAQRISVLTWHNDNARTGQNTNETILTPSSVNSNSFGLLFTYPVDGFVYAQPLVLTNVAIPGQGTHDVVFVATEHDSVYALDAHTNSGPAGPLWRVSFINPGAGITTVPSADVNSQNIVPEIGITSTPVIDPGSGTIYVEAKTKEVANNATTYVHRLHALDVTNGAEKFGGPVVIQATVPGTGDGSIAGQVAFAPWPQLNRSALLLVNGTVYVAFASHNDTPPFHGWLFGYNAETLQQVSAFNTAPNGSEDGIWMAGAGPAADAAGTVYFVTGNGTFNTNYSAATNNSLGGSFVKLSTTNGLALADYFRPHNQASLDSNGEYLGSGGVLLLPDSAGSAAHPHLMVASGKSGNVYLVDRDNLGQFNSAGDGLIAQELTGVLSPCYSSPALFNNQIYYQGIHSDLLMYVVTNGGMSQASYSPTTFTYPGATPVVSANGTNNAVVWVLQTDQYASGGPAILHAYNANNVAQELYDSSAVALRDTAAPAVKFSVPTVANGDVYVGGQYGLSVFGAATFTALPTFNPAGGVVSFTNLVTLAISDATPGAVIYYTLDGTTPTTNSTPYLAPLTVTNTVRVNALAVAPGALPSPANGPTLVNAAAIVSAPGLITQAFYPGATRAQLENPAFSNPPSFLRHLATFEEPAGDVSDYTETLVGWFIPPLTGNYVFFVAASDDADLFLSTDGMATNEHLIAQETAWSVSRQWLDSSGGSVVASKRSDQFAATAWPTGNTITLTAGVPYYIQGVHHASVSTVGNFAVTCILAGNPAPANGTAPALAGAVLTGSADGRATITITNQPQHVAGNLGARAQFGVGATTAYFVDAAGGAGPSISYQWQSAPAASTTFTNIPSATNPYYATPPLALAANGEQFQAILNAAASSATSLVATLTVSNNFRSVLTYHYDNARTGQNTNETTLTPANVNSTSFGLLFTYPVDGYVYAQPLIMTNVPIPGSGSHNAVFVATEHNSLYAFDADSNVGPGNGLLWHVSFINPAAGVTTVPSSDTRSFDLIPEVGITSTPVIDPVGGTIYVEVKTKEVTGRNVAYVHRLHALDITTGNERTNSPVVIISTNYPGAGESGYDDNDGAGHVSWNPLDQHNRPGLLLLNGAVYIAYASHGDAQPYHGWLFGYDAHTLQQTGVFNVSPNGAQGGVWMAGCGPAADAAGNVYLTTGNGDFNTNYANAQQYSLGMSFLRLSITNGLGLADFFAPSNQAVLSAADQDLCSGGIVLLPDSVGSAAHPHLAVAAGKEGKIYLLDRDNLGHFNAGSDSQIVQELPGAIGPAYSSPAYFNGLLYYQASGDNMKAYIITNGLLVSPPGIYSPNVFGYPGATPSVSANGASNAIAWVLETDAYGSSGPAVLRAYDAYALSNQLYNSDQVGTRDLLGAAVKFAVPTIANGKVYVGVQYGLSVFGNGVFLQLPQIVPPGGIFTNSVAVAITDAQEGTSIYYTLDGSAPSTNSLLYDGPFALTNTSTVKAIAYAPGAVNGAAVSATFVDSSATGLGTGLTGGYYANTPEDAPFTFIGSTTFTRVDPTVNFLWGTNDPAPGVPPVYYSVRWTGMVQPQFSEIYTFYLAGAGVRLLINGQMLLDEQPLGNPPLTWSVSTALQAQQMYNMEVDCYEDEEPGIASLSWSSPSTPESIVPQSQLYPLTNPPPMVVLTSPANGSSFTASASVTISADAADQYNTIASVSFYTNGVFLGALTNVPYTLTASGLMAGSYTITAVASDTAGITSTSAPLSMVVTNSAGGPYGLTNIGTTPAFFNMPLTYAAGVIPPLLSQTGVFSNTPNMSPANGLIPYSPNVPLWSDGASKTRYFAIPNNGPPYTPGEQVAFAPTGTWSFPAGTVFVKTFALLTNQSDPTSLLRLETRLLVRDINGAVYGVTYKWRPDYSDADLLTGSLSENIAITTPTNVITQAWYYPSPSDCLQCHTAVANYVLGVNAGQLNGNFTYPNGVTDNELRALNRTGLFYPAIDEAQITNIEQLSALTNLSASYVQRARSYLDANCAQCHQPGGTGPTFDARYDTPLTNQNIINTPAVKGNLGYDNVDIVTPDDVWRSSLYDRMNVVNPTIQMPPLARNLVDTNAVQVMADWINSLPGIPAEAPPIISPAGGTFTGGVTVTILPPDPDATVYYTLNGTLPTTNSFPYTGPFNLTNTATVSANAFETNFVNSVAPSDLIIVWPGVSFTAPGSFTNGKFEMQISGIPGQSYVIQTSTDLANWTPFQTNVSATSPFSVVDPGATNYPLRFYRAVQKP
jgi:uncharacterized repeat protein (TIGR03806 family)